MELSICIITYNHEQFIKECLDGVLMQNFNYDFEILISDDCSTDKTIVICEEYQKRFPHLINILRNDSNIGMAANWYKAINSCKGKFIAICEGDDYWVSNEKIHMQYEYMKMNDRCNLCFHDVILSDSTKEYEYYFVSKQKDKFLFNDILLNHIIPTCSMMIRASKISGKIPNHFFSFPVCDVPVHLLLVSDGYAYQIKKQLAVYRINEYSITNNRNKNISRYFKLIKMYLILIWLFRFRSLHLFFYKIARLYFGFFRELINK